MQQNHIKATFVVIYMTGNVTLFLIAIYKLISDANSLAWLGAAMASGAVSCLIGLYYGGRLPRTTRHIPILLVATTIGTALAGLGLGREGGGQATNIPFLGALVLSSVGTLAYLYWYSILGRSAAKVLRVGEMLPVLDLEDEAGQAVRLDSLYGVPLLLVFYRGNWCPLCMAQVRELADQCQEFQRRGVTVILVSPQPQIKSAKLAKRLGVPFRFLVDKDGKAARELGIKHIAGLPLGLQLFGYKNDTVFPTVIVADKNGKIAFIDQTENYRVRPKLETLLEVLQN